LSRVQQVLDEGVVEIWLTSEDTGTYGRDIGTSLPELLWKIIELLPNGVMLRVGMVLRFFYKKHELARWPPCKECNL
jgi:threonylcarbamoyladenosine tRNA methylthiotransferase CDKAL1